MMENWMALVPFAHQEKCFQLCKDRTSFAFLMEQGTGKTKVALDKTVHLFLADKIDALVVVAPNGVHRNWIEREIPKHVTIPYDALIWSHNHTKKYLAQLAAFYATPEERRLKIIVFNIECFRRKLSKAIPFTFRFLRRFRSHVVVDESSGIKNYSATQTKVLIRIGKQATCRGILTGTPVTEGPLDYFSQFQFLKPGCLGYKDWVPFKSYYAEWREHPVPGTLDPRTGEMKKRKELVRYKNLDELKQLVDERSFTVRKSDCLDLPPKVYVVRPVEPSPAMSVLYEKVKKEVLIELAEDSKLTIRHSLTRLLRLSQVTGGFVATDEDRIPQPIEGSNPKILSLLGIIEEMGPTDKLIVWARFIHELRLIRDILVDNYKSPVACWWGEIEEKDRNAMLDEFMTNPMCRFFIGQPHSGGYGTTITAANHVCYFSNDFSLEARLQSEDRAHRIGQTRSVTYYDLMIPNTIDEKLLKVLSGKLDMANFFKTPGEIHRWLE